MKKLLILDRDGVINEDSDAFIKSPEEWRAIPGSLEAIRRANRAGYRVVVFSNQSGVGRGLLDINTLNLIHQKMHQQVNETGGSIEAILFCPHKPEEDCDCRKPKTGMLDQLASRLGVSLTDVPVVGDRISDIQAARDAGAKPVLVRTGKGRRIAEDDKEIAGVPVYQDLAEAVDSLIKAKAA
jgi:D-glycero-D-manno-heptose 1,7-bisphosphate phosphatase